MPSRVIHLAETVSTNIDAFNLATAGERGPLWVVADRQTAGKGRAGRGWTSLDGNLHASFLQHFDVPPAVLPQISLVAGVAAVAAIRQMIVLAESMQLRLKWPNDILLDGAKVAGLLIESTKMISGEGTAVVVGVGINVAAAPIIAGRPTASLRAVMRPGKGRDHLLAALDRYLDRALQRWDRGANFATIKSEWMAYAGPIGQPMTIQSHQGPVSGCYDGLDDAGGLRLRLADGTVRSHDWGDVTIAAETSAGAARRDRDRE